MSSSQMKTNDLESQLTKAYDQQAELYKSALGFAEGITEKISAGDLADDLQDQLSTVMKTIAVAQDEITPMREEWDTSGREANLQLRESVERLRSTIERVMSAVSTAESVALEAKEKLEPQLGAAMTSKRMVSAYNSAKTQS